MSGAPPDAWSLLGQTILVTGSSSGIGQALCRVLAERGARLLLSGRDAERLEATCATLLNHDHVIVPYDLTRLDGLATWLKSVAAEHGKLAGLAHCAGIFALQPARLSTQKTWERVLQTNLIAGAQLAAAFRHPDVSVRPANIVFVSSVAGLVGDRAISAYAASKGGILALTRALAIELASEQIRVNCVVPGQVDTPMRAQSHQFLTDEQAAAIAAMHPLGIGLPEDVAHAIAFLLMPASRWITGSSLVVDGGYTAH